MVKMIFLIINVMIWMIETNKAALDNVRRLYVPNDEKSLEGTLREYRHSEEFKGRFNGASADLPPAMLALIRWEKEQRKINSKWKMYQINNIVDPTLSSFGNMATRYMLMFEKVLCP